jgi:hypothetical protein
MKPKMPHARARGDHTLSKAERKFLWHRATQPRGGQSSKGARPAAALGKTWHASLAAARRGSSKGKSTA